MSQEEEVSRLAEDCSLADLLNFDDTNNDGQLNLNEFYTAFSKLYSKLSCLPLPVAAHLFLVSPLFCVWFPFSSFFLVSVSSFYLAVFPNYSFPVFHFINFSLLVSLLFSLCIFVYSFIFFPIPSLLSFYFAVFPNYSSCFLFY